MAALVCTFTASQVTALRLDSSVVHGVAISHLQTLPLQFSILRGKSLTSILVESHKDRRARARNGLCPIQTQFDSAKMRRFSHTVSSSIISVYLFVCSLEE